MPQITWRVYGPILVDPCDVELAASRPWRRQAQGYAVVNKSVGGKSVAVLLHRLIAGAQPGEQVDHVNGDALDNRRCNLRICTPTQNMQNRRKSPTKDGRPTTSQYKGVHFDAKRQRWIAQITIGGVQRKIGRFRDEMAAAAAYDVAACRLFGDFALTNGVAA